MGSSLSPSTVPLQSRMDGRMDGRMGMAPPDPFRKPEQRCAFLARSSARMRVCVRCATARVRLHSSSSVAVVRADARPRTALTDERRLELTPEFARNAPQIPEHFKARRYCLHCSFMESFARAAMRTPVRHF